MRQMSRRMFNKLLLGLPVISKAGGLAHGLPRPRAQASGPNIVMIIWDDCSYGDLSPFNNVVDYTPNIQALADQGTIFTHFYSANPVCAPARFALHTGQYPNSYGITKNNEAIISNAPGVTTIAQRLRAAGYHTMLVGKWHLGGSPDMWMSGADNPINWGFDQYLAPMSPEAAAPGRINRQDSTIKETVAAIDAINSLPAGEPFYLCLAHQAPHVLHYPFSPGRTGQGYLADSMADIDDCLGKIVDHLTRRGQIDNTLFVMVSDHGPNQQYNIDPATGAALVPTNKPPSYHNALLDTNNPRRHDHGKLFNNHFGANFKPAVRDAAGTRLEATAKGSLYEGGIRVPCIIRWPGGTSYPGQDHGNYSAVDLYTTIEAIATGTTSPAQPGIDILTETRNTVHSGYKSETCVIQEGWKLMSSGELYSIGGGIDEDTDRRAANPEKVAALEALSFGETLPLQGWES